MADEGIKASEIHFRYPKIEDGSLTATLCVSGRGSIPEFELSDPTSVPPTVAEGGGEVTLTLLPDLPSKIDKTIDLSDRNKLLSVLSESNAYIRISGRLRCKLTQEQMKIDFDEVTESINKYLNSVASSGPGKAPDTLIYVSPPDKGGAVHGSTSMQSDFREFIHIRYETRQGVDDSGTFNYVFDRLFGACRSRFSSIRSRTSGASRC